MTITHSCHSCRLRLYPKCSCWTCHAYEPPVHLLHWMHIQRWPRQLISRAEGFSTNHWAVLPIFLTAQYSNGYGSKLGTPKLWMVNTKLDIHICGPLNGLPFWPTSKWMYVKSLLSLGIPKHGSKTIRENTTSEPYWVQHGVSYNLFGSPRPSQNWKNFRCFEWGKYCRWTKSRTTS